MLLARHVDLSRLADRRRSQRVDEIRRRPDGTRPQALETLAHALEYLIKSSINTEHPASDVTMEAIALLSDKSREIFAECPEITTLSQRLTYLLPRLLTLPGIHESGAMGRLRRPGNRPPKR